MIENAQNTQQPQAQAQVPVPVPVDFPVPPPGPGKSNLSLIRTGPKFEQIGQEEIEQKEVSHCRCSSISSTNSPFIPFQIIGKGSYGLVVRARWKEKDVAVKFFQTEAERAAFRVELLQVNRKGTHLGQIWKRLILFCVSQLSRVAHPNIICLFGASTTPPHVYLVMEYAECGSLYKGRYTKSPKVESESLLYHPFTSPPPPEASRGLPQRPRRQLVPPVRPGRRVPPHDEAQAPDPQGPQVPEPAPRQPGSRAQDLRLWNGLRQTDLHDQQQGERRMDGSGGVRRRERQIGTN